MSQNLLLVSKANYLSFTSNWQQLLPETSLNSYFQVPTTNAIQPVYGVRFPIAAIQALLSTVGITKVKARFCIENGQFNIILFATDEQGIIHSAYYIGTPSTARSQGGGTDGNISRWIARTWIDNWANTVSVPGSALTPAGTFKTSYGVLQGYTYEMKDFMNAMYKGAESSVDTAFLLLHFALPHYYREEAVNANNPVSTFSLVLQRVNGENGEPNPEDDAPYYDISAPCPPICGSGSI